MIWKFLSFDLRNVVFAACFTLRGHEAHINFLWVLFMVGRIGPLIQTSNKRSLLRLTVRVLGCLIFSKVPPGSE